MRKKYPSDISREQYELIRADLEGIRKKTRPYKYDTYDVFCAILYMVKEGCTWRAIPHDFPKWENVRYHYDKWTETDEIRTFYQADLSIASDPFLAAKKYAQELIDDKKV